MLELNDYEKGQVKDAIRIACEHYGYGSSLSSPYALKFVLNKKLESIRNSQYQGINDSTLLLNTGTSAMLIRAAIAFLEKEYQV